MQISPNSPKVAEPAPPPIMPGHGGQVPHSIPRAPSKAPPTHPSPERVRRSRDPRKRSRAIPVLVISLVGVVMLGGFGGAVWWLSSDSGIPESSPSETRADAGSYGSDPNLDNLWDECAEGNLKACDDLYLAAADGSDYENFGATCGDRSEGLGSCVILGGTSEPAAEGTLGSDAGLDLLWTECESGDMTACDDLYLGSPVGSEYEQFGATCGERGDAIGECAARFP